jgi:hypothetical protein
MYKSKRVVVREKQGGADRERERGREREIERERERESSQQIIPTTQG